ncbi:MAG TPA: NAD(P)H-dependent oxidoreductase [Desulfuromonadales bacterium]|nr:NAD(P)H-dependent oxidoreductase [Desulfuromonadales bacterium]
MKILIINAHPEPQSFCSSLFHSAVTTLELADHQIQTSNLYTMEFDPISDRRNYTTIKNPDYLKPQIEEMYASEAGGFAPDLEAEMCKVEWCDLMIWHFPLWWFSVPAILKGWFDRVFAMGRFYGNGHIYETGVMQGKKAMLSLTTGGPLDSYQPDGFNGDINGILRPIHRGMLEFVGFEVLLPQIFYAPAHKNQEERTAELQAYCNRLKEIESEQPVTVGRY